MRPGPSGVREPGTSSVVPDSATTPVVPTGRPNAVDVPHATPGRNHAQRQDRNIPSMTHFTLGLAWRVIATSAYHIRPEPSRCDGRAATAPGVVHGKTAARRVSAFGPVPCNASAARGHLVRSPRREGGRRSSGPCGGRIRRLTQTKGPSTGARHRVAGTSRRHRTCRPRGFVACLAPG